MFSRSAFRGSGVLSSAVFVLAFLSPRVFAQNLVINPDFSAGNTGFSTTYTYFTGSPLPAGRYTIESSPRDHHPLQADFHDHTTGTGLMMVVNGGTLSNVFDYPLWQETLPVQPGTSYDFSFWTTTANAFDSSPANLWISINGQFIASNVLPPTTGGNWANISNSWLSGTATTAYISIFDVNTASNGNDVAFDDFDFHATSTSVPEAGTLALLAMAAPLALGLGVCRLGQRKRIRTV